MRNKNVSYVKVRKGDLLLLIPTERESGKFGIENQMLWSIKEFDFKVFAYLDVDCVIYSIMRERALAGLSFYDIDMDMYDENIYPDSMEVLFKNSWDYAVMRQTYRYFDQLLKKFTSPLPTSFAISCCWNNNTRDVLAIYPLDDQNILSEDINHLGIMFSSYTTYSEEMIENFIVGKGIGECEKLPKDYEDFQPVKEVEKILKTEHLIEKHNGFFLLKDNNVYCGMKYINPNILMKINWRWFADEMIHPKGCKDCNIGYKMEICLPKDGLKIFKHSIHKDYGLAVNDCYSVYIQLLNIINSQWKKIQKKMDGIERIVFEPKYDDKKNGKGSYIVVQYLDKEWKEKNVKEITYTHDGDYIVQGKKLIENTLNQK